MQLPRKIPSGTRVDCNVRGRMFSATVEERTASGLRIQPPRGITYYNVTANQVVKVHTWDPYASQITKGMRSS